jgi:hypothetical protein
MDVDLLSLTLYDKITTTTSAPTLRTPSFKYTFILFFVSNCLSRICAALAQRCPAGEEWKQKDVFQRQFRPQERAASICCAGWQVTRFF